MKRLFSLIGLIAVVAIGWFALRDRAATATEAAPSNVVALLSEPASEGFARATEPNNISFPRDLGPHDDYQTEWWYYTGNLATEAGREFGFQFTIFRRAIEPPTESPEGEQSEWRTNQIYLVHFTVSDIEAGDFYHSERFSRGGAELAGAQADPYRVWVEDWYAEAAPDGTVRLFASSNHNDTPYTLDLNLTETLPPILHGDGGLSAKSLERGNASYYYSLLQQQATGSVTIDGTEYTVTGKAWKDHEYSTSVLTEGATGWDWFSLQFEDGTALMLFQIRRDDGSVEPASSGTFVFADGSTQTLALNDFTISPTNEWTSPATNATYPIEWQLSIPSLDLAIEGGAKMPNQELTLTTAAYWEGAVEFTGTRGDNAISGVGYTEMTGYSEAGE